MEYTPDTGISQPQSTEPSLGNVVDSSNRFPVVLPGYSYGYDGTTFVYNHGYDCRVNLLVSKEQAISRLSLIDWSPEHSGKVWCSRKKNVGSMHVLNGGFELGAIREPAGRKKERTKEFKSSIRGGKNLGERAPTNATDPLGQANKKWKTKFYAVVISVLRDTIALELKGVRINDLQVLLRDVLGFATTEYRVDYFRRLERYIVLSPKDAHRLAESFGEKPRRGRGRLARKYYLLHDREVWVPFSDDRQRACSLNLYFVIDGATCPYKLEVAITGNREDHSTIDPTALQFLDRYLLSLVDEYKLEPQPKPDRWEPEGAEIPAIERDWPLSRVGAGCYRGRRPGRAKNGQMHTKVNERLTSAADLPWLASTLSLLSSRDVATNKPIKQEEAKDSDISDNSNQWVPYQQELSHQVTRYIRSGDQLPPTYEYKSPLQKQGGPWQALADEQLACPSSFVEVALDGDLDPGPYVRTLLSHRRARRIGVGVVAQQEDHGFFLKFQSMGSIAGEYPITPDCDLVVLYFDEACEPVVCPVDDDVVVDEETGVCLPREFVTYTPRSLPKMDTDTRRLLATEAPWLEDEEPEPEPEPIPVLASGYRNLYNWERKALALSNAFETLRNTCESSGKTVVIITQDIRSRWGKGELTKHHHYSATRVRSSLGDAPRYFCHARYFVERDRAFKQPKDKSGWCPVTRIIVAKDEFEGRTGRLVYRSSLPSDTNRRPKKQKTKKTMKTRKAKPTKPLCEAQQTPRNAPDEDESSILATLGLSCSEPTEGLLE